MTVLKMTDLDLQGKRVLIREDLNVPVKDGVVTSDARILASLPTTIVRQVDYTEGSARGDTSGKVMKPAKLKNGTELSVADFVEIGDWIEIDTRDGGSYKGRAKV